MAYPTPLRDQIIAIRLEMLKLLQAHHDSIFLRFCQVISAGDIPSSKGKRDTNSISSKIVAHAKICLFGTSYGDAVPNSQPLPPKEAWALGESEISILDREMDEVEGEMEDMRKGIENVRRGGMWGSYEICTDSRGCLSSIWFRRR